MPRAEDVPTLLTPQTFNLGLSSGPGITLPGDDKEDAADTQVGEEHVHPDVRGQGIEEGEDAGVGAVGLAIQDAHSECHERLGEIDGLLTDMRDGQGSHGQVCLLQRQTDQEQSLRSAGDRAPLGGGGPMRE